MELVIHQKTSKGKIVNFIQWLYFIERKAQIIKANNFGVTPASGVSVLPP